MGKHRPPAFQFYPADYLTDPKVVAMSLEARGAYVHLLCAAWLSDEPGYLRDDDTNLAKSAGAFRRWGRIRNQVLAAFDLEIRPGWLVQKRMVEERLAQIARYEAASRGGSKAWEGVTEEQRARRAIDAARKRWGTDNAG